jgi:uncharacterized protein with HEPN domain
VKDKLPYLYHIRDEILYLKQVGKGLSLERLMGDEDLKRSIPRSLSIIGEAAKNLPAPFRDAHPEVPWADMAAMRDKLIHGYFGIKWGLVLDVIVTEIPALDKQIEQLISEIEN